MIQTTMMMMIVINATRMKTPITTPIIVMGKLEATEKNREREREREGEKEKEENKIKSMIFIREREKDTKRRYLFIYFLYKKYIFKLDYSLWFWL